MHLPHPTGASFCTVSIIYEIVKFKLGAHIYSLRAFQKIKSQFFYAQLVPEIVDSELCYTKCDHRPTSIKV